MMKMILKFLNNLPINSGRGVFQEIFPLIKG